MRVVETPPALHRATAFLDGLEPCYVPRCGVRSRNLDALGMCPRFLWDENHDAYLKAQLRITRERAPGLLP